MATFWSGDICTIILWVKDQAFPELVGVLVGVGLSGYLASYAGVLLVNEGYATGKRHVDALRHTIRFQRAHLA